MQLNRRHFLNALATATATLACPSLTFAQEKSGLKITSVRIVTPKPKRPLPAFTPAPTAWSTQGVEVASPMSVYPDYKSTRSLFMPDANKMPTFFVEITTDKGIKGFGQGGIGGGPVVEQHLAKLLIGKDPFDIERLWDTMWRSTMYYDRAGIGTHAISGVDLALWDIIGKALKTPVYRLIGGKTKDRIPAYCTGNDIDQHLEFGFKRLKLAMAHGPADGREGMRKNADLVKATRAKLGPEGDIMLDCWMAWTEDYTLDMADMLGPYNVYWLEEVLQPHDYAGFGRLKAAIKHIRIATGEHEYTRYGFRQLLEHNSASIWQPDMHWCGGLTELRRIAALAAAYDITVLPHVGGTRDGVHFTMATTNAPWSEMFMPAPGGPKAVYDLWSELNSVSRGPDGIYTQPPEDPGLGWDFVE